MSVKKTNDLASLPMELGIQIFSFFQVEDLTHRVNLVCRKWREIANDDSLWREFTIKRYGKIAKEQTGSRSWKEAYQRKTPIFFKNVIEYRDGKIFTGKETKFLNGSVISVVRYIDGKIVAG